MVYDFTLDEIKSLRELAETLPISLGLEVIRDIIANEKYCLSEIVRKLEARLKCNCELDNWEPEKTTGHSCVCRIHKLAIENRRVSP